MINNTISKEWLQSLSTPKGQLKEIQKNAREAILLEGLPNQKDENWRLTNFKHLEKVLSLPITEKDNLISNANLNSLPITANETLTINLDSYHHKFNSNSLPKGVELLNNTEIDQLLGKTISLGRESNSWPISINHATTNHILGLYLHGSNLPPIELVIESKRTCLSPTRMILIIEENTTAEILQVITGNYQSVQSHILEINLKENSKLKHGCLTLGEKEEAKLFARIAVKQDPDSEYCLTSVQQGWSFSRFEPQVVQPKGRAKTTIKGLQIATGNQQVATHSFVNFQGPKGTLNQLQKAIANNSSHSIFNGAIEVPQNAQQTEASQLSKNILLSKRAKINTKPELEIVADDVKCSHGATISQLQEEELFYLRSRGISNRLANSLLIKGFYNDITTELPRNANRWEFRNKLETCIEK